MNNKRWNLEGKKALITGATKGIGAAIAQDMLQLGAEVFITARKAADVQEVIDHGKRQGYKIYGIAADISKSEDRVQVAKTVADLWPSLDILVNNVGTNIRKKTHEYSEAEYDFLMTTNLKSAFEMCRLTYPHLKLSSQGNIINISSVAGLNHLRTGAIYGMSKAAMIQLTKNLAVEWAPDNIRVNAIAPWYIRTPLAETVLSNKAYLDDVLQHTPMGKTGEPEDVAGVASFLCMPAAAYITGQCIAVDGGFSIFGF
jgi:Tropinone reductase 1